MNRQVAKSAKSEMMVGRRAKNSADLNREGRPSRLGKTSRWTIKSIIETGLSQGLWRLNFEALGPLAKAAKKSVFVKVSLDGAGPMAIVRSDSARRWCTILIQSPLTPHA